MSNFFFRKLNAQEGKSILVAPFGRLKYTKTFSTAKEFKCCRISIVNIRKDYSETPDKRISIGTWHFKECCTYVVSHQIECTFRTERFELCCVRWIYF